MSECLPANQPTAWIERAVALTFALGASLVGVGCDPEALQYVDVGGESGTVRLVPAVGTESQYGRAEMGATTGLVDELAYRVAPTRRVYLVRDDLDMGLDPIAGPYDTLHFPHSGSGDTRVVPLEPDDKDWASIRGYDIGACSLFVPWRALDTALPVLVTAYLSTAPGVGQPSRLHRIRPDQARIGPILRRLRTYVSADQFRVNGGFRSESVGGCRPMNLSWESRYEVHAATGFESDLRCDPLGGLVQGSTDFRFVPVEARAEVHDFCIAEGDIEDNFVRDVLEGVIPTLFQGVLEAAAYADASDLGLPEEACTCSSECRGDPLRGPQSRCVRPANVMEGVCNVAIELDRVMIIPEGIMAVFAEDDEDPQWSLMAPLAPLVLDNVAASFGTGAITGDLLRRLGVEFSCDPARSPVWPSNTIPDPRVVPGVVDPTAL